ncbi:DUF6221 family protein [Arthrobacter sp. zg-Y20]|uniref:DUF6221 family protein n=1 Tax=unclassified Arthrobacter TaxID=235627 RepID=UPI001D149BFA|nr:MULTISPECIES: DUF6221 family protein [unclassified Arthrobacter]MCC3277482.1 DUF6221 family protein [Arthrobacter sp. zg-Y20]MDK1317643.1 DUF6221 family protein [Arthrobacter sp. zg.Y20]WIB07097.1 DUF6221 family protein [Arthrobacter sp. zg-Y20]
MSVREFLLARIAEDEEQAEVCRVMGWVPAKKYGLTAVGPDRLLAECAAKRTIVEAFDPEAPDLDPYVGRDVMQMMASVYSDHPDYRTEWAA